jgi:hypothetical protein
MSTIHKPKLKLNVQSNSIIRRGEAGISVHNCDSKSLPSSQDNIVTLPETTNTVIRKKKLTENNTIIRKSKTNPAVDIETKTKIKIKSIEKFDLPTKSVDPPTKPVEKATKPVEKATKPVEKATKPVEKATKSVEKATKSVEKAIKKHSKHKNQKKETDDDEVEEEIVAEDHDAHDFVIGPEIATECFAILKKNDPKSELSKDDLIEKIEDQLYSLTKNKKKYSDADYNLKSTAINKILSKLRVGLTNENLKVMNTTNKKIDKIVLDKKIPKEQFKKKIDLTGDHDNKDPTFYLLTNSREYFKKVKDYVKPPPELQKIDPSKKKGGFGNAPIPTDMLSLINFQGNMSQIPTWSI